MKTVFKSLPVLIICSLFIFAACADDNYENAMLNISVNNDRVRAAALAIAVEEIDHQIVLTGPTGTVLTYNISGAGNLSATIAAGTWRIDVTGYYGEEIYSWGTASVAVTAGQSNSVSVLMTVVWQEGGFIPPGSDLPQLPGTAYISGDNWFNTINYASPVAIHVWYDDPTWDSTDPAVKISPKEGFIVDWYVGGRLVQTDTDAMLPPGAPGRELVLPASSLFFKPIEEYWNRDVFAIVRHGDYNGVRSNNLRICKPIETVGTSMDDWDNFIVHSNGWEWEGNSFIITTSNGASLPYHPATPIGSINEPFNGYLDGNGRGFDFFGFTLTSTDNYAGLFAYIGPHGTVMNITLTDQIMTTLITSGECYMGGVAGLNEGTIINIAYDDISLGQISANNSTVNNYAGGIAGYNKGIIKNCFVNFGNGISTAPVDTSFAGGIAGVNEGEISFCWVASSFASIHAYNGAGGIAGKNDKTINHCVVLGGNIQQSGGTYIAGRIWGTGNGTGRANWANSDNDFISGMLKLFTGSGSGIPFAVDYTDNREDSKHGKGVQYTQVFGNVSPDDAGSENWWMYTAGWDVVWYPNPPLSGINLLDISHEKPWWFLPPPPPLTGPTPPPFAPVHVFYW